MDITPIEQTPEQIEVGDPIQYEFKVPQVVKDDFGNEYTQYRKDIHTRAQLDSEKSAILANIEIFNKELSLVEDKIKLIDGL